MFMFIDIYLYLIFFILSFTKYNSFLTFSFCCLSKTRIEKLSAYECGFNPFSDARISLKYVFIQLDFIHYF